MDGSSNMGNVFDEVESEFGKLLPKTTIEMDDNFSKLPSGAKVESVSPQTEQRVHGYAYPELGQVATGHTPLSQAPKPPPREGLDAVVDFAGKFGEGTSKFVSGMAGFPVDAISGAMRGVGFPVGDAPVGGSQSIRNALAKGGMSGYDAPNTQLNRAAGVAGEYMPGVLTAPFFPGQAGRVLPSMLETLAPTLGSAAGAITARELKPDSPGTELALSLAGGLTPASVQHAITKAQELPKLVNKRLGVAAPVNKQEFGVKAQQQATGAVEEMIYANRELPKGFQFRDEAGRVTKTGLPETLEEATQALPQAKAHVYQQFNAKQKEAGKRGLSFEGDSFVSQLERWRNNPDLAPSVSGADRYLGQQIKQFAGKTFTPQQIENELAAINSRLKAHFKNPDPNKVSSAMVDSELLKILNNEMDTKISLLASEGYGELRNAYGNLKSIEDRLNRSAVTHVNRLSKDPTAWLPKGWDAGWALEMIGAVHYGHPMAALAGVAAIGGPRVRKWLVDPDRNIKALFKEADKLVKPREKWSMGERTFTPNEQPALTRPFVEGEVIPPQKQLPPLPGNRLEYTGRTGKPPIDAEWKPVLRTGQKPGVVTNETTVYDAAPFDFDSAVRNHAESAGISLDKSRNHVLEQIKAEMIRRRQR